jgi:antitoxin YefM
MTHMTASQARIDLYRLIDSTTESHEPVTISGKRNSAVLVSEDDWRAIQETLYLNGIPGMRESIEKGIKEPLSRCSKTLKW